jgi:hypothetical protein
MTPDEPLSIPRRLAIALMAAAQQAPDGGVRGFVGATGGRPVDVYPVADPAAEAAALARLRERGQSLWAVFRTGHAGDEPTNGGNFDVPELVIAVDTKGVLQLRCRQRVGDAPINERGVRIDES